MYWKEELIKVKQAQVIRLRKASTPESSLFIAFISTIIVLYVPQHQLSGVIVELLLQLLLS